MKNFILTALFLIGICIGLPILLEAQVLKEKNYYNRTSATERLGDLI